MAMLDTNSPEQVCSAYAECAKGATVTTFSAIIGDEPVYQGKGDDARPGASIIGIISIISKKMVWSVLLEFPRETAVALAERFAGFEIPFEGEDMGDVVGELANILAGDLTSRLSGMGIQGDMSLPTIVRGSGIDMIVPEGHSEQMSFSSSVGAIHLRIVSGEPHNATCRRSGS